MNKKKSSKKLRYFNTFSGVFLPTFLSIIGVILYLRLGYIVGQTGVWITLAIIVLAVSVTLATGLSLSSITTNIRIGAGGAYSIISKTLGLEVGGSVGIPLFLAQIFSIALYILGFAEAWNFMFPSHPYKLVVIAAFIALFLIVAISTNIAVKVQIFVFIIILLSFLSVGLGGEWWQDIVIQNIETPTFGESFWSLFALFFPAVTGLMAGIGLSGQLQDPKKQIPRGILAAIGITTIIYILAAIWFHNVASSSELIENSMVIVSKSFFPPIVLFGVIAATFSSALTTLVAAPRLLQAMSNNHVIPLNTYFAKINKKGEPIRAIICTSIVVFFLLLLGSFDKIAVILTMFFLITYATINIVVFIEQSLGAVSFRPTLKIPKIVPLYGAISSIVFMFLISAWAGIIALGFLMFIYVTLVKKNLKTKEGDVRSGIFVAVAEWAAKKVSRLPENIAHTWKPNILLPVVTTKALLGNFPLIKSLTFPNGTMTVLGLKLTKDLSTPGEKDLSRKQVEEGLRELPRLVEKFSKEQIFTSFSDVTVKDYTNGICVSLEAIAGQVFHPNILFLPFRPNQLGKPELERVFSAARKTKVGVVMFDKDEDTGLGSEEDVHIWISDEALQKDVYDENKVFDLGMILAYRLNNYWHGNLNIWMCTTNKKQQKARYYLQKLIYETRFPNSTKIHISTQPFLKTLEESPQGDIHIIPVRQQPNIKHLKEISGIKGKSFLYVSDSSQEDVLA